MVSFVKRIRKRLVVPTADHPIGQTLNFKFVWNPRPTNPMLETIPYPPIVFLPQPNAYNKGFKRRYTFETRVIIVKLLLIYPLNSSETILPNE
jgi:alkaline phosphatase